MRIERKVERQPPFSIVIDGASVDAYPGETLASVLIERGPQIGRTPSGAARGMFCNMGTCSLCMVTLLRERRRVRACLTPVEPGLEVALG